MKSASEVAAQLAVDLYGIPAEQWGERELKIITQALTAFRDACVLKIDGETAKGVSNHYDCMEAIRKETLLQIEDLGK